MKADKITSLLLSTPSNHINNFIISGGSNETRSYHLVSIVGALSEHQPIILISGYGHQSDYITYLQKICKTSPLWCCDENSNSFEPFLRMNPIAFRKVIQQMFEYCRYDWNASVETVVNVHLSILQKLKLHLSLSALYYLCCNHSLHDYASLREFIMRLDSTEQEKQHMWADLDVTNNASAIESFRSVIRKFSEEAQLSGWRSGNLGNRNLITAVHNEQNPILYLQINNDYSALMQIYLSAELQSIKNKSCTLLFNEIKFSKLLAEMIWISDSSYRSGVIGQNVASMLSIRGNADENSNVEIYQWLEQVQTFVLFHHNTGPTCNTWSNVIGKVDQSRISTTAGSGKGFLSIFPEHYHDSTTRSIENRFRVMPEEFQALSKTKCIVFDAITNRIYK